MKDITNSSSKNVDTKVESPEEKKKRVDKDHVKRINFQVSSYQEEFEKEKLLYTQELKIDETCPEKEIFRIQNLRHRLMNEMIKSSYDVKECLLWANLKYKNLLIATKQHSNERYKTFTELETVVKGELSYIDSAVVVELFKMKNDWFEQMVKECDAQLWNLRDVMKFRMFLAGK